MMPQQDAGRSTGKLSCGSYFDLFNLVALDQIRRPKLKRDVTDPPRACQRCSGLTFAECLTMSRQAIAELNVAGSYLPLRGTCFNSFTVDKGIFGCYRTVEIDC